MKTTIALVASLCLIGFAAVVYVHEQESTSPWFHQHDQPVERTEDTDVGEALVEEDSQEVAQGTPEDGYFTKAAKQQKQAQTREADTQKALLKKQRESRNDAVAKANKQMAQRVYKKYKQTAAAQQVMKDSAAKAKTELKKSKSEKKESKPAKGKTKKKKSGKTSIPDLGYLKKGAWPPNGPTPKWAQPKKVPERSPPWAKADAAEGSHVQNANLRRHLEGPTRQQMPPVQKPVLKKHADEKKEGTNKQKELADEHKVKLPKPTSTPEPKVPELTPKQKIARAKKKLNKAVRKEMAKSVHSEPQSQKAGGNQKEETKTEKALDKIDKAQDNAAVKKAGGNQKEETKTEKALDKIDKAQDNAAVKAKKAGSLDVLLEETDPHRAENKATEKMFLDELVQPDLLSEESIQNEATDEVDEVYKEPLHTHVLSEPTEFGPWLLN